MSEIEVARGDHGYHILWDEFRLSKAYTREVCIGILKLQKGTRKVIPLYGHRDHKDLIALCNAVNN